MGKEFDNRNQAYGRQAILTLEPKASKVTSAFGIPGRDVAPLYKAMANSSLEMLHFRHEDGTGFATCEASLMGTIGKSPIASKKTIKECSEMLFKTVGKEEHKAPFAILVGFRARQAADKIRQLAEATGAVAICSPRVKGVFPKNHRQFVEVTGFDRHQSAIEYLERFDIQRLLVLGASCGEFTSLYHRALTNNRWSIQVDCDREVLDVTYPSDRVLCVESDSRKFVKRLQREYEKQYRYLQ